VIFSKSLKFLITLHWYVMDICNGWIPSAVDNQEHQGMKVSDETGRTGIRGTIMAGSRRLKKLAFRNGCCAKRRDKPNINSWCQSYCNPYIHFIDVYVHDSYIEFSFTCCKLPSQPYSVLRERNPVSRHALESAKNTNRPQTGLRWPEPGTDTQTCRTSSARWRIVCSSP